MPPRTPGRRHRAASLASVLRRPLALATLLTLAVPAVAQAGKPVPPPPGPSTVQWSGATWHVRDSGGQLQGPGPNRFSSSTNNVWVDASGALHLRITQNKAKWSSAEVFGQGSLGYGTYRWVVDSPLAGLDAQAVLGLFTWSDDPAFNHRELDVEAARWGNASDATNAQFVVQPYDRPGNLRRFTIPVAPSRTTYEMTWSPGQVAFKAYAGLTTIDAWTTTSADVPPPGDEKVHLNLWLFQGRAPQSGKGPEVVVRSFTHTP